MEITFDFPQKIILKGDYLIYQPDISEEEFWELANEDSNFELIDGAYSSIYRHRERTKKYFNI